MALSNDLLDLLGPSGWLTEDTAAYQTDWLRMHDHAPLGVARPKTTEDVVQIIKLSNAAGVSVTPQGGNTSLCGGAVPAQSGQIILSLSRMNDIGNVQPDAFCVTVGAGVVLANLHDVASKQDMVFPMHLGAEGTAQIGGLIATNAGGSHALRYGMMQDLVLGLEVVLPDGQVWDGMRSVQKDNAGYQLRKLFCGAEGTLGIVTHACLRLFPAPVSRATALLVVEEMQGLVPLGQKLRCDLGEVLTALEFFSDVGLELALQNVDGLKFPLDTRGAAYVLIEVETSSAHIDVAQSLEAVLEDCFETDLCIDGALATSEAQRAVFWRLREEMPEGQRVEGAQIKHDISVPVAQVGTFIDEMGPVLEKILPGIRINPFGHLGDGNIHFNLSPPKGHPDFSNLGHTLSAQIYKLAEKSGGSLAAEHGLGRSKIAYADDFRGLVERQLMADIKQTFDPKGTLNPNVIVKHEGPQDNLT